MEEYVYEINFKVVQVVCRVVDEFMVKNLECFWFVVGVIGLINCMALLFFDVNDFGYWVVIFDELWDNYYEQAKGFMDGGVDFFFIEIVFDMFNVKVVFFVIDLLYEEWGRELFVMVLGMIMDVSGRMLLG